MSGFCRDDANDTTRQVVSSRVEAVTTALATPEAPPRSLLARQTVASAFSGGAALDPETGALIGVIASGSDIANCSFQDPEGTTIVYLLAPYRRLLLEFAARVGETLRAELRPGEGIRPCEGP